MMKSFAHVCPVCGKKFFTAERAEKPLCMDCFLKAQEKKREEKK